MVFGRLCCVLGLPPPAPVSSHGALASDAPKSAGPTSKSSPDPAGPLLNPCFRDAQGRCLGQSAPPPARGRRHAHSSRREQRAPGPRDTGARQRREREETRKGGLGISFPLAPAPSPELLVDVQNVKGRSLPSGRPSNRRLHPPPLWRLRRGRLSFGSRGQRGFIVSRRIRWRNCFKNILDTLFQSVFGRNNGLLPAKATSRWAATRTNREPFHTTQ